MAGCKKLRQGLKCHHYVLKKHKYEEIINYVVLIVYNSIMYITIKINGKWQIFLWAFFFDLPKKDVCLILCVYVSVCLFNLLPGGREINRGTTFANDRPGITMGKPTRAIIRWEPQNFHYVSTVYEIILTEIIFFLGFSSLLFYTCSML